jgi:sugar phosphate isomerase/epimerase
VSAADASAIAFLVAAAAHAGFQVTVTTLVYPTLARVPSDRWVEAHRRHSRGIVPLVVLLYGALVVTSVPFVAHHHDPAAWVGAAGAWGAMLVTATAAAPTHARLTTPEPRLLRRLLAVDRVRAVLACVALAGAAVTALSA